MQLQYSPVIALLGVHPRGMETYVHTKPVHGCAEQPCG